MAKGEYADWLTPEDLLKIEGWVRDELTDEQINMALTGMKREDIMSCVAVSVRGRVQNNTNGKKMIFSSGTAERAAEI